VAIVVRFAWVYPAIYLPPVIRTMMGQPVPAPQEGEVFIMSWCGMRGIVSLAAALALPQVLEDGSPFPERDLIIFLTFVVIAVTLVIQGLSLKPLIRRLQVGKDWSMQEEQQRAKMALGKAAIAAIDSVVAKDGIPNDLAERIRAEFAEQITLAVPNGIVLRHSGADDAKRLRAAAVKAERHELIRLWRENQISDDVLHKIEEDLDYQESRIWSTRRFPCSVLPWRFWRWSHSRPSPNTPSGLSPCSRAFRREASSTSSHAWSPTG
jgi:CPA1 family monovalent cation:H+ antiporter